MTELEDLGVARRSLSSEIAGLEQVLAQGYDESTAADSDAAQQVALREAEQLGALRNRASQAQSRAAYLEAEIEAFRRGQRLPAEARFAAEVQQLRAEIEDLRTVLAATASALLDLRREHIAALAGLVRPGPVDGPPAGASPELASDYLALSRSGLMDARWYRRSYPDIDQTGVDPVMHYLEHGWREGRRPGPAFDGAAYLIANPSLVALGVNPLVHYLGDGAAELRPIKPDATRKAVAPAPATTTGRRAKSLRIVADLQSYDEYQAFRRSRPEAFSEATELTVRNATVLHGTRTEFLGQLGPEHTAVGPGDLRECLMSGGLSSRTRAIADLLLEELRRAGKAPDQVRIYGHEAVTYLASLMRGRFARFLGTEYAPDDPSKRRLLPYIHNDVCASQFPDDSFDATFSCDVLEHVYDRDAALRETARTTGPGGVFLATFPFFFEMEVGSVFAEVIDGELVHHLETPIYHGNPVDEEGGALVFEIPGWDIVERVRKAGFSTATMRFICDEEKGVTSSGEGRADGPRGVFVLVAHK